MDVTFNAPKDAKNIRKHGVSLQRAADFDTASARYDVDNSQDYGEVRWNAIGWLDASLYSLTFTQDGQAIRAISLRKATKQEEKRYAEEY